MQSATNSSTDAVPANSVAKKSKRKAPMQGSAVIWPAGLEAMLGISPWVRWSWERKGKLPPRDVCIAGKKGWRPETLQALTASEP